MSAHVRKAPFQKTIFDENAVLFGLRNMGGKGYLCLGKIGGRVPLLSKKCNVNFQQQSKMKNPPSTFNVTGAYFSPRTIIFVHAFFESTKFDGKQKILYGNWRDLTFISLIVTPQEQFRCFTRIFYLNFKLDMCPIND